MEEKYKELEVLYEETHRDLRDTDIWVGEMIEGLKKELRLKKQEWKVEREALERRIKQFEREENQNEQNQEEKWIIQMETCKDEVTRLEEELKTMMEEKGKVEIENKKLKKKIVILEKEESDHKETIEDLKKTKISSRG